MSDSSVSLLGLLAAIAAVAAVLAVLHLAAWLGVRAATGLPRRADVPLRRATRFMSEHPLWSAAVRRFPRAVAWMRARLVRDSFLGLPLTLLACGAAYFAALFAGLLDEVLEVEELALVDAAIEDVLAALRTDAALALFAWITEMGSAPAMLAVALVGAAFLLIERRLRFIPGLWAAVVGAHVTTWTGKYVIHRDRPDFLAIASADSPSFPSGHATAALAVYGFLAYAVIRQLPSLRARFEIAYWTAALVALIAFSRVYLRVHYASDVAAGLLVGAFWLFVGIAVAEWPRRVAPGSTDERADQLEMR